MGEGFDGIVTSVAKSQEEAMALVEKLFSVAQPGAVYSEPVTTGEHMVITASEVRVGMGFGAGGAPGAEAAEGEEAPEAPPAGYGSWGGGGASGGRPVAAISVSPDGVRVEPVVDATKIVLALFATVGAIFMMVGRIRAMGRKLGGR